MGNGRMPSPRYTLSDAAAEWLRKRNDGEAMPDWTLDAGTYGDLHEIYDLWQHRTQRVTSAAQRHEKTGMSRADATLYPRHAVIHAIAHTAQGQRLFRGAGLISYPGILSRPVSVFELREEYREHRA